MNKRRAIGGFVLSFVFLALFIYSIAGVQWIFENSVQSQLDRAFLGSIKDSAKKDATEIVVENVVKPNPAPEIFAGSAVSVESNLKDAQKVIFEKSADVKLPIASLTKLMTAVIVLDNYNLSDIISVSKAADSQDSIKQDVKLGDTMPVGDFFEIMLIGSSNKSAYVLSEKLGTEKFVGLMNEKAKNIGLNNTFFADPTGLSAQNVSTANDLARLAEYILKNYPRIADISKVQELFLSNFGNVTNTDQLLGEIPDIVCSKTGFTTQAKGCLLLVVNNPKNNGYLINVVLGADDRFSEMRKIINWSSEICK